MKFCITCVYWVLLLISIVSSGLLFIIVASEGIENAHSSTTINKGETTVVDNNNTGIDSSKSDIDPSTISNGESHVTKVKAEHKEQFTKEGIAEVSASFESPSPQELPELQKKEKDVETFKDSLTQQPNLSQGISETGQAVVLTLVDTATAELKNLADPRIPSEFRGRSSLKNLSLNGQSSSTLLFKPLINVDEFSEESNNATFQLEDIDEPENATDYSEQEQEQEQVVLVVRAEKKSLHDSPSVVVVDESSNASGADNVPISEEIVKADETLATSPPELRDSAARERLAKAGGNKDVIYDGIVSPGGTSESHEDIPSFNEWTQKRLEEAEKKKTAHPNVSIQSPNNGQGRGTNNMKVRSKNYASPDCGAKIVAMNPEARSARSILVSTRDEYMLNTCNSRIWFVVELCEAIQAKKIELANFELFSSGPKDFSVYVSDRFPTRDWSHVGQFTAKDERDIQSFSTHPHLFGKFIKVEFQSHYGSEHYCPISLFRAYGTSEFEVLETETEAQVQDQNNITEHEDEDEIVGVDFDENGEIGDSPRNLFGSAKEAVLSIVQRAAQVLGKTGDHNNVNLTKIQAAIDDKILDSVNETCHTSRYKVVCNNCSEEKFARVLRIANCRDQYLKSLIDSEIIKRALLEGGLCRFHGFELMAKNATGEDSESNDTSDQIIEESYIRASFLASFFTPEYIVALCNVLAFNEGKAVLNVTSVNDASNVPQIVAREEVTIIAQVDNAQSLQSVASAAYSTVTDATSSKVTTPVAKDTRKANSNNNNNQEAMDSSDIPVDKVIDTATASGDSVSTQIKPTKTLVKEEDFKKPASMPILEPSKESVEETSQIDVFTTVSPMSNAAAPTKTAKESPAVSGSQADAKAQVAQASVPEFSTDHQETADSTVVNTVETVESVPPTKTESKAVEPEQPEKEKQQAKVVDSSAEVAPDAGKSQDPLSFDNLFSEFKEFESEVNNMQNGQAGSGPSSQMHPTASSTPQQKESVFLRLSNRIKALERNMSLSGQYLEELSRRYKKQVEEMQRSLERAIASMNEESRKGEEREIKRLGEIAALREEVSHLTKSVDSLLHDRDSWRSKFAAGIQHVALIFMEIVIAILIISYCRRLSEEDEEELPAATSKMQMLRRKSVEILSGQVLSKKPKKRRPSEATHVTGTYKELMIEEKNLSQEARKERKKKRKREASMASKRLNREAKASEEVNETAHRRASSTEAPVASQKELLVRKLQRRPESAPDCTVHWFTANQDSVVSPPEFQSELHSAVEVLEPHETDAKRNSPDNLSTIHSSSTESNSISSTTKVTSPSFMKTALGARKKRMSLSSGNDQVPQLKSDNWQWYSMRHSGGKSSKESSSRENGSVSSNGLAAESHDETPNSSPMQKKEKKATGLKKMVRKLF